VDIEKPGLQDYFALLRRRRSNLFMVLAAISVLTVFGTLFIDDQYRSTATIAIERPEIPENMIRTTVTFYDTDLRIDRNRDKVLARPNIEAWIKEYNLYESLVLEDSLNAAVAEFRDDVEILTIQVREDLATKNQGDTIAFDLSFYGESPEKAVQVAARLASQFLEENRKSRNQSVEETVAFFQRDADRLAVRIADAETKLAEFKERNAGALPESSNINAQMLDRTERELDEIEREIRDLREQRKILETDLSRVSPNAPIFTTTGEVILAGPDRLKLLQQELIRLSAKYGPQHPDVITAQREIALISGGNAANEAASVREELQIAQREYAAAQQRYTADHPDVRILATRVKNLEAKLTGLDTAAQTESLSAPDNPEYINILVQIDATDADLSALRVRVQSSRQRISRYEGLLLDSPQVEREFLALQREYDQAIREAGEVRIKQTGAQQARDLELSEKGERYVLQRSPSEPLSAAFPNRIAIIILGNIFAIACAFGAVVISEALDPTVRGVRDLKIITGMPPIGVIPILETQAERRRRAFLWSFSALGVSGLIAYLITIQV